MPTLLVYGDVAYLDEEQLFRLTNVSAGEAEVFRYAGERPEALWRIEGAGGSMLTGDFKAAVDAFKMGGNNMVKIEIVLEDVE